MTLRPLIAGNWKMNGLANSLGEARALAASLEETPAEGDVALCPPATLLAAMARTLAGSAILTGGQDCAIQAGGAYTGDISAEMLGDAGAALVIVGHSERRAGHGETNAIVLAKAEAAARAGLRPIICVGETLAEREAGRALEVVTRQVGGSVPSSLNGEAFYLAYEPVWAIGTGLTPTTAEIEAVHQAIRKALVDRVGASGASTPILYGGSVKPSNAAEILHAAEVGGALVGGASLKAVDFLAIIRAL